VKGYSRDTPEYPFTKSGTLHSTQPSGGGMLFLIKFNTYLIKIFTFFSGLAIVVLTGIAAANMLLRVIYVPINGSYELIGFCGAVATGFAFGYTQVRKDHIIVTIFTDKFSPKTNKVLDGLNYFVNMIFFFIVSRETLKWGFKIAQTGELSETLKIIYHPFIYCLSLGFAVLSFTLLIDFLKVLWGKGTKK
jgi:TRAP-type C4-dicarboxylate transport system permease small subunit